MKTGVAHLPLHGGKTPAWLFSRMKLLAAEIARLTETGRQFAARSTGKIIKVITRPT